MNGTDRLVILSYDYPPNNGGIARLCFEIKKQCEKTGREVLVVTPVPGKDMENDRNVIRVSGGRGTREIALTRLLKKTLRPTDVVLAALWHPDGTIARLCTKNVYVLAHGAEYLPGDNLFRRVLWNVYRKRVLCSVKGVVANSHYTENLVKSCLPSVSSCALPLAVDCDYFHPTVEKNRDGVLRICTLSRLEQFKAQDFVIETIGKLPEEYRRRIRYTIGGKGVYRPVLERLVEKYGLQDIVTFVGFVSDGELRDFYSAHDVYVLCTREEATNRNVEGFGLVFTEAQACGTPVVATRTGGIPDAVEDGNGGWLIEQDNAEQLANLLTAMVDDKAMVHEEGKKARERMLKEYSWEKYVNTLMDVLI